MAKARSVVDAEYDACISALDEGDMEKARAALAKLPITTMQHRFATELVTAVAAVLGHVEAGRLPQAHAATSEIFIDSTRKAMRTLVAVAGGTPAAAGDPDEDEEDDDEDDEDDEEEEEEKPDPVPAPTPKPRSGRPAPAPLTVALPEPVVALPGAPRLLSSPSAADGWTPDGELRLTSTVTLALYKRGEEERMALIGPEPGRGDKPTLRAVPISAATLALLEPNSGRSRIGNRTEMAAMVALLENGELTATQVGELLGYRPERMATIITGLKHFRYPWKVVTRGAAAARTFRLQYEHDGTDVPPGLPPLEVVEEVVNEDVPAPVPAEQAIIEALVAEAELHVDDGAGDDVAVVEDVGAEEPTVILDAAGEDTVIIETIASDGDAVSALPDAAPVTVDYPLMPAELIGSDVAAGPPVSITLETDLPAFANLGDVDAQSALILHEGASETFTITTEQVATTVLFTMQALCRLLNDNERAVLAYFREHPGQIVSVQEIAAHIGRAAATVRTLMMSVVRFVNTAGAGNLQTIHGQGYQFTQSASAEAHLGAALANETPDPAATYTLSTDDDLPPVFSEEQALGILTPSQRIVYDFFQANQGAIVTIDQLIAAGASGPISCVRSDIAAVRGFLEQSGYALGVMHTLKERGYMLTRTSNLPLGELAEYEWNEAKAAELFASNPRVIVTRQQLAERIWPDEGMAHPSADSMIQQVIKELRPKLRSGRILTLPGTGYFYEPLNDIPPSLFRQLNFDEYSLLRALLDGEGTLTAEQANAALSTALPIVGLTFSTHSLSVAVTALEGRWEAINGRDLVVRRRNGCIQSLSLVEAQQPAEQQPDASSTIPADPLDLRDTPDRVFPAPVRARARQLRTASGYAGVLNDTQNMLLGLILQRPDGIPDAELCSELGLGRLRRPVMELNGGILANSGHRIGHREGSGWMLLTVPQNQPPAVASTVGTGASANDASSDA